MEPSPSWPMREDSSAALFFTVSWYCEGSGKSSCNYASPRRRTPTLFTLPTGTTRYRLFSDDGGNTSS